MLHADRSLTGRSIHARARGPPVRSQPAGDSRSATGMKLTTTLWRYGGRPGDPLSAMPDIEHSGTPALLPSPPRLLQRVRGLASELCATVPGGGVQACGGRPHGDALVDGRAGEHWSSEDTVGRGNVLE